MSTPKNDNIEIRAPKPIDTRMKVLNVAGRNALGYRWPLMIVGVEDIGDGNSQWQYLNRKTGDDLTSNDYWVPLGGGSSGDVIQTVTASTAATIVNLATGNIVYVNVQADTEIDLTNIVPGKKYSFILTMQGPPTKTVTFNTTRFKAAGPFADVVLSTGVLIDQECVIVDIIGVTVSFANLRSRSDLDISVSSIIQQSQYVQQVSYVDSTTGSDTTGSVNDPSLPFETIKAAVDSLTAAICSIRIGAGVHECPVEVLQDIDPRVQSLTMESAATTINATENFIKANQTTLYDFSFFGKSTDINAGNFAVGIEGSNIYKFEMVVNNLHGDSSPLVLIHPGFNNVVINGNVSGGTVSGGGITIRDAANSEIFIRGNITSAGNSQFSNCIDVRNVKGNLNVTWGGVLSTTLLTDWRSNAIRFDSNNISSDIKFKGNIVDDKPSQYLGTILILGNFNNFTHEGDITVSNGTIVRLSQNFSNKCSLSFKGKLTALAGEIFRCDGVSRNVDVYFNLNDSSFTTNGFALIGAVNLFLNGRVIGVGTVNSLFQFPATVPANINVFVDDLTFEGSTDTVPLVLPATVTSGTASIKVNGTLRTNSTVEVPAYAGLQWLTDITLPAIPSGGMTRKQVREEIVGMATVWGSDYYYGNRDASTQTPFEGEILFNVTPDGNGDIAPNVVTTIKFKTTGSYYNNGSWAQQSWSGTTGTRDLTSLIEAGDYIVIQVGRDLSSNGFLTNEKAVYKIESISYTPNHYTLSVTFQYSTGLTLPVEHPISGQIGVSFMTGRGGGNLQTVMNAGSTATGLVNPVTIHTSSNLDLRGLTSANFQLTSGSKTSRVYLTSGSVNAEYVGDFGINTILVAGQDIYMANRRSANDLNIGITEFNIFFSSGTYASGANEQRVNFDLSSLTADKSFYFGNIEVDFRNPTNGQVFTYNGTKGLWETPSGGSTYTGTPDQIVIIGTVISLAAAVLASLDLADSAVQSGANISIFTNDSGYLTTALLSLTQGTGISITGTGDSRTIAIDSATQTALNKANSSLQPGSNISVLNNNSNYLNQASVEQANLVFQKGIGSAVVTLTPSAGELNYNLLAGNKFTAIVGANVELKLPSNDTRGQNVEILIENSATYTTFSFALGYIVLGDTPDTSSGRFIMLTVSCWSNGKPWVVVTNQP